MLRWFESRLDPYPGGDPVEPPKGLLAFCLHYSHGAKRWLALMAVAAAAVAIGEIIIFGFIGDVSRAPTPTRSCRPMAGSWR